MSSNISRTIPTFIINLKRRGDRKTHTLKEFNGREEFELQIVEALECSHGALGLWSTIRHILLDQMSGEEEYVLIGEDDIEFTEHYSKEHLFDTIDKAKQKGADVLLGGVSWYSDAVQVSDNLYWVDSFTGTHFTIIFKKFYQKLITTDFRNTSADFKMVSLSRDIMFMSPLIATQKDFGYSDATRKNNIEGRVDSLFRRTAERLQIMDAIKAGYNTVSSQRDLTGLDEEPLYQNILIPTYVILDEDNANCDAEFLAQFKDKSEFDLHFIQTTKHESHKMAFWLGVRQAVNNAIADDDDLIIICNTRHRFSADYDRNVFIANVINAHEGSADILFGGADYISDIIPFTPELFWIGSAPPLTFAVLYRKFYEHAISDKEDELINKNKMEPYWDYTVTKLLVVPAVSVAVTISQPKYTEEEAQKAIADQLQSKVLIDSVQQAIIKYQIFNQNSQKVLS